jgi:uncharacterized protein (DUF302 family)
LEQTIAYQVRIQAPFDEAVAIVSKALKSQGFGILTQIDVKSTLKEKLDEDFRPYMIFGACNPPLAHRALTTDARVGVMLPCNVTVEQQGEDILVSLANPEGMLTVGTLGEHPEMKAIAQEANERIQKVAALIEKHV